VWLLLSAALGVAILCAQGDDLAEKSRRGKELMGAGNFREAARVYAELVKAIPNNPGLLMNLGMAENMAGEYRKSIQHLEGAVKLAPGLLPAWLFLGVAHLQLGEPERSLEPLRKALAIDPNLEEGLRSLGDALFSLGRLDEALAPFQRLVDVNAKDPRAWYGLGHTYDALSRRAFASLEKSAPASGYWLALAAGTRLVERQYSSAFYLYREALAKQPNLRGMHGALADIYRKTGHADWAAVEEGKERQMGPLDCASSPLECVFMQGRYKDVVASAKAGSTPESYYWLSLAYNELALEAFARLAQLPESPELHQLKAEGHRHQGQHLEAVKEWREALKLAPNNLYARRELAIALHDGHDYAGARGVVQELLKLDPESAELNYYLGDSLLALQQGDKAIPFLRKAVARDPTVLPAQASLARAYLQVGKGSEALPYLKAALPVDDDGSLHYQLARAYQNAGQAGLAKEALQKSEEIRRKAQEERQKLEQEVQILPP
jgi:tetratricopeptide (TPR) repeat protein